jgi:serine/threonine protein kinase
VLGTWEYAAPEYIRTGHLTLQSDIWSFGIVLLELLSGRRAMDRHRPSEEQNLLVWAKPFLEQKLLSQLIDPQLNNR